MIAFEVLTLFPEILAGFLEASLLGKARERGLVEVHLTDPRSLTADRHRTVDDTPYGGGVGMVMKAEPLVLAIEAVEAARGATHRLLLSPQGMPLCQRRVRALAAQPRILLICGRYEGIDERVRACFVDQEVSVGDFVLAGGEVAAMALIEAVARLVPGVVGKQASTVEESFAGDLLEYPQYTRPPEFRGLVVPEVLLSGDHERIRRWRRRESLLRTRARRPDLFARVLLSDQDRRLLAEVDAKVDAKVDTEAGATEPGGADGGAGAAVTVTEQ